MTKQAFFIGIKGVGMTALALAMQDGGWTVMGSDTGDTFITDPVLSERRVKILPLGSPIPVATNLIVYSGAYPVEPTPGIRTVSLAVALAEWVAPRQVVAVAGVGGKTTTTAMLACLCHAVGRPVGYYVGTGRIAGLPAPGATGTDPAYIVEADEYRISKDDLRPKFSLLTPQIVVTTNIVHDHPDVYKDVEATLRVFAKLIQAIPPGGTWICNPADPLTHRLLDLQGQALQGVKIVTYGPEHPLFAKLELAVFGEQNRLDALAAVLAALELGISIDQALLGITSYHGTNRRQESHGELAGRLLYDDYAHHPGEIAVTLRAFQDHFPDHRVVVVFEPHTYSRTAALLSEFAQALRSADQTFLMPIFASAREQGDEQQVTSADLAALIPGAEVVTWESAAKTIWAASRPGDIILTMGAGFVYKLHDEWKKEVCP
jgi:UDP-N-acetylmuramate--alanine ligase